MRRTMSETVDTSVKSEVYPHLVSQQAECYGHHDHALKNDNPFLQRFNIPLSQVNKVGLRWTEDIRIYNEDNKLYISVLPLDKQNEKVYPRFFNIYKGSPKSNNFMFEYDELYLLINNADTPFVKGQEIQYNYVEQSEGIERHIVVENVS